MKTLLIPAAGLVLALAGAPYAAAADPQPVQDYSAVSCRTAMDSPAVSGEQRLEMLVELTYHALQTRQLGLPVARATGTQLGLLIEQACRENPDRPLQSAVDLAVNLTFGDRRVPTRLAEAPAARRSGIR